MTVDQIKAALMALDPKNDALWTEEGAPVVKALGKDVTRTDIVTAAPHFTRTYRVVDEPKSEPEAFVLPIPGRPQTYEQYLALKEHNPDAAALVSPHVVDQLARMHLVKRSTEERAQRLSNLRVVQATAKTVGPAIGKSRVDQFYAGRPKQSKFRPTERK